MDFSLLDYESLILSYEIAVLILLTGLWEALGPSRPIASSVYFRWFNHFALLVVNNVLARLLFPAITVSLAIAVSNLNWGMFILIPLPSATIFILTFVLLDLNNYFQHWLMHRIPLLWRFHKVHHCDIDVDWSTAFRFHPGESMFTLGLQGIVIALLGAPPVAVAVYEILFIVSAFFVHANIVLPCSVERVVRSLLVTPNMHRIHHSTDRGEGNSNFSGIFSWWDRWFSTYIAQPKGGQLGMKLGLIQFRDPSAQNLIWLLGLPFHRPGNRVPQLENLKLD